MKANSKSIIAFMSGTNKQFLIPVYQRNYNWNTKDQCQTLWNDLGYIKERGGDKPHFFGSIVSVTDTNNDVLIIIDGQQRLTTVSLLLLAIAHKAKDFLGAAVDCLYDIPDPKEVLGVCLDSKKENKLKLKLIRDDMAAYQSIIDRKYDNYDKTNVVRNYKFFCSVLTLENIQDVYNAVQKLEIVDIRLSEKNDDNPQLVFESLNSKGMDLTDADKIRNFILIGLDYQEQERLYSQYWEPMEENTGTGYESTSTFIWYYLAYKTNKKVALTDVYKQFKEYRAHCSDAERMLQDLFYFSEIYNEIKTGTCPDEETKKRLENLITGMQTKVALPLLLDVFDKRNQKLVNYEDISELLQVIEAYFVRRSVCRFKTAGTEKFFLINKKIDAIIHKYDNATYLDVFKFLIYYDRGLLKFPDDTEFRKSLEGDDIYSNDKKTCKYILKQLEMNKNKFVDVSYLNIEHIMPQKLDDEWKSDLGPDWERVHAKYLHALGNLTLVGYNNSEYGNRPFRYKKRITGGFDLSSLYLNGMMKDVDEWTETQIKSRTNMLVEDVLAIWPTYKPMNKYSIEKDRESVALDNDDLAEIVVNRKPAIMYFRVFDKECDVVSWKDLYSQIINMLYDREEYKQKMKKAFGFGNDGTFENIISKVPESSGKNGEILWEQIIPSESIYFHTNKSAIDILNSIKKWFTYLKIDHSDLEITLKSKN